MLLGNSLSILFSIKLSPESFVTPTQKLQKLLKKNKEMYEDLYCNKLME